jgi:hypothetical protein
MKESSRVSYTLLIAAIAVLAGSLVTVGVMSLQQPKPSPASIKTTPPVLSLPSPIKPTTETKPTSVAPAEPVVSGTPATPWAQQVTVKTYDNKLPTDPASLEEYRYILEQTVSDYWMKTYATVRPGSPGVLDLDLARWIEQLPQVSIPASLASWPTVSVTPWNSQSFTATFSKAKGSSWLNFGDAITFRYIAGGAVSLKKDDPAVWTAVACPASTPDDITAMANIFALAYPPAVNDEDLCSHIATVALESKDYPGVKAYTLNTNFASLDNSDGWGGGEGGIYRPTIIMKSAKKEDMFEAIKNADFSMIEPYLRTYGTRKISALAPTVDLMISLMGDLNVDGWCGYDNCY